MCLPGSAVAGAVFSCDFLLILLIESWVAFLNCKASACPSLPALLLYCCRAGSYRAVAAMESIMRADRLPTCLILRNRRRSP